MKKFLVINGPNLNMLGQREPDIYGKEGLEDIIIWTNEKLRDKAQIEWWQSNIEGEIVTRIQATLKEDFHAIILNPGGYSHTSVAIHDALKMIQIPVIEVHLSQVYHREDFRHTLLTAKAATAIMSGLGKQSYYLAISSQL